MTTFVAFGQDTTKTSQLKQRDGYEQWTKYRTSLRIGLGIQKSFFPELGISRHKYTYNDLGFASSTYYTSFEWTPPINQNMDKSIYGVKIGYEINARTLALGFEIKYQKDIKDYDFVITPKIGFGFFGILNIFYGYNISTVGSPFSKVGHNQFSIIFNLNRQFFKNNKVKK